MVRTSASKIEQEITPANTVVVLWSAASQQFKWVRDEAAFGRDANKLIPLKVDSTTPSRHSASVRYRRSTSNAGAGDPDVERLRQSVGVAPPFHRWRRSGSAPIERTAVRTRRFPSGGWSLRLRR